MYLELAFAVAAHLDPEILIVDEVLAVGDVAFQRKCLGKMGDVARQGRTVLLVSHNLTAIQSLCQSCVLLHQGRMLMQGSPESCVRKYMEMNSPDRLSPTINLRRPAGASAWMTSVTMFADGEPSATPRIGASVSFEVEFESENPMQHPRLGLTIGTAEGFKLVNLNNRYQPSESFSPGVKSGTIVVNLGQFPFLGTRYYVSLFFGSPVGDTHDAENALVFEGVERNIWGQGRVPPPNASAMWWPATYELIPGKSPRREAMELQTADDTDTMAVRSA